MIAGPFDGAYDLQTANATRGADDRVTVNAVVENDGSDIWTAKRCLHTMWLTGRVATRDEARAGVTVAASERTVLDDSSLSLHTTPTEPPDIRRARLRRDPSLPADPRRRARRGSQPAP